MSTLDILHLDDDLLILNKPADLLCVPGLSSPDNLYDMALKQFPNARVVHRLDMSTSGIVLFALNHFAQKHISKQFAARTIKKHYSALVSGIVKQQSGEISLPLICDWERRPRQKIDWHEGKAALTQFSVEGRQTQPEQSRLALYPLTGRSHQLRVHCLALGHPIVGDPLYNASDISATRMCLHATRIEFDHPRYDKRTTIHTQAPF